MAGTNSGDRDEMLRRIRSALAVSSPDHATHARSPADRDNFAKYLPPVRLTADDRLSVFASRCEGLKTRLVTVARREELADALQAVIVDEPGEIAFHDHPLVTPTVTQMDRSLVAVARGYQPADLERCVVGVTSCTALIAQTGSILITSAADGGRALSIIAHHHVVLATISQLVRDLPSAYAAIDPTKASMISLISGPSRTGDIERILVLGAHGPRKLTVILALND